MDIINYKVHGNTLKNSFFVTCKDEKAVMSFNTRKIDWSITKEKQKKNKTRKKTKKLKNKNKNKQTENEQTKTKKSISS